jgi:hypothetical protein
MKKKNFKYKNNSLKFVPFLHALFKVKKKKVLIERKIKQRKVVAVDFFFFFFIWIGGVGTMAPAGPPSPPSLVLIYI